MFREYEAEWERLKSEIDEEEIGVVRFDTSSVSMCFEDVSFELRQLLRKLMAINDVYIRVEENAMRIVEQLPVNMELDWENKVPQYGNASVLCNWNGKLIPSLLNIGGVFTEDWMEQFVYRWLGSYYQR